MSERDMDDNLTDYGPMNAGYNEFDGQWRLRVNGMCDAILPDEAIAHRMETIWNACRGIPTADLTRGVTVKSEPQPYSAWPPYRGDVHTAEKETTNDEA